jgi:putative glycosyltransferase (TIGR04372 family)
MFTKKSFIFEYSRIRNKGFLKIILRVFIKTFGFLIGIIAIPLAVIAHALNYRYVNVFTERIGHLAIEPDILIKDSMLHQTKMKWIILAPYGKVANSHLLSYWDQYFIIFRSRILCFLIYYSTIYGIGKLNISHYINTPTNAQKAYLISGLWNDRSPLLKLSNEDLVYGEEALLQLGIPKSAWFVCIHAREGLYSPIDEPIHQHRNSDINTYLNAVKEIISRGGYVIRVGDHKTKIIPKIKGLIDYSHSQLKSERLDIYILAKSKFILGDSSGVTLLGSIFGTPCALVNMTPLTSTGILNKDLAIHKLYSRKNKVLLSLNDLHQLNLANARNYSDYTEEDILIRDNSATEILELTIEMLNYLDQDLITNTSSITNVTYLTDKDYSYGTKSRIGQKFLERYACIYHP